MAPVVRGGGLAPVQGGEETGQPPGERPRLWWCPAGPLGLLPLHSALTYDPERGADTGTVDRVVSAYTPTLKALLEAPAFPERPACCCTTAR
jgi:hypothetical protein